MTPSKEIHEQPGGAFFTSSQYLNSSNVNSTDSKSSGQVSNMMMEEDDSAALSPPQNKSLFGDTKLAGVASPNPRRLCFDDDDDDGDSFMTTPLPPTPIRQHRRSLKPINLNNETTTCTTSTTLNTLSEIPTLTPHAAGGRKRSSAERKGESPGAASMHYSPHLSPNSFMTMDGRFVQSKNPFSSPMIGMETEESIYAAYANNTTAQAPTLPGFYTNDGKKDGKMMLLPPRAKRMPHNHSPSPSLFDFCEDTANGGSLQKVPRYHRHDDVVAASSLHMLTSLRIHTTASPANNNAADGISPTEIINFPPPTPKKKKSFHTHAYPSIQRHEPEAPHRARQELPREEQLSKSRFYADFDIIGELGKGSFGTVYKVLSRLDGCMYAIKLAQRQARGTLDRDRMLKEVYALAALSDQADPATFHIVRYHQAWMEDDRLYIQTELCSGTLADEIARGLLTDDYRRYKVLREILVALEFIHNQEMCHLDIKPENIFIKNDQFKLGDFGLVTRGDSTQEIEEGDSRYMSMELLSGDRSDLTKSDIFSLGITLYEMCLGRPLPMNGQEWQDLRAGYLSPFPNTRHDMAMIIKQMMEPSVALRPTASKLLTHPQLLSDEQKALQIEKCKVMQANMQLAAQTQQFHMMQQQQQLQQQHSQAFPRKVGLQRANTWSGGPLPYL
jgi:wee1-like protein kinase